MKLPYILIKLIENPLEINLECLHSLFDLLTWLEESKTWASKGTHYDDLDIWWKAFINISHDNLYEFGFIDFKGPTTPEGSLWWLIYQYDPCDSPNLKTQVQRHHASAFERAECALIDLEQIYNFYLKRYDSKKLPS
jgi:hypothetical protein